MLSAGGHCLLGLSAHCISSCRWTSRFVLVATLLKHPRRCVSGLKLPQLFNSVRRGPMVANPVGQFVYDGPGLQFSSQSSLQLRPRHGSHSTG
ncbi:uncharacterized protein ASPGLDRAFT_515715 [Aspergillus glaucus CBS 516.65]|uniref:Uncharacterized protein n=1 Tax=Aspergillus glaucus CBS 516.65 TaxID=1160497 RepID=A0A1L9VG51_ASPGL|nr:hypothetical protein ASPGLDRAFT_515715 [Aspergillus glaucus CBS 516.65]OJJ82889.1 hypothetical protein ASPGLDRAFT_515715 [Aspergillus glaucus CBS 516.65]